MTYHNAVFRAQFVKNPLYVRVHGYTTCSGSTFQDLIYCNTPLILQINGLVRINATYGTLHGWSRALTTPTTNCVYTWHPKIGRVWISGGKYQGCVREASVIILHDSR